ncbi:MAG TPA: DUF2905 domain-containing protein [Thermoanaerobaculia bacterium]|nr:DUF2905 domain-containing protein [Thermoanaerobaculia bacterium]
MPPIGKFLIIAGIALIVAGLAFTLLGRMGIGRLPGDFVFRRGNVTFFFPLMTSVLLSILLTLAFWLFRR